jgi:hypothetical protein
VLSQLIGVLKQNSNFETGFWYLSDHGESTGEHGLYLHGSPYATALEPNCANQKLLNASKCGGTCQFNSCSKA